MVIARLFYGHFYNSPLDPQEQVQAGESQFIRQLAINMKLQIIELVPNYDEKFNMLFPPHVEHNGSFSCR